MKLFFRKMGKGDPVFILHGLFGASDNWLSIARSMPSDYLIYLVDMRNHGRSQQSPQFNYSVMVDDIYEFFTDFNIKKASLVGHSMGGMASMYFALEYPHRVERLIVVDIAPKPYPLVHNSIIEGLFAIDPVRLSSRKQADQTLTNFVENPKVRQFLLKNLYRRQDGVFAWRLNLEAISKNLSILAKGISDKRQFSKPTLFIRGESSDYILPDDHKTIRRNFPKAQILTVAGASHWVHNDAPEQLLSLVTGFLSDSSG